jgi:lipoteichoic acid synthase
LRVERAYTAVPHTTKSLLPIHCGYYPKVAPGFDEAQPGALPTECLAATLARLGWATAYVQSSESVFEKNEQLVANFGYQESIALDDLDAQGLRGKFDEIGYFGLEDRAMLGPLLKWVDDRAGQPFVVGVVTLASHHPYDVPAGFARQVFAANAKLNNYLNAVAYTDKVLGELHRAFADRGLLDRTVFVYIGDHGEGFGEHGLQQHDEVLYEEGVRVPLLIEAPGLRPQVVGGLRQNIDVVPNVLELLGLDLLAGGLDGRSLLSTKGHTRLPLGCWHRDRCLGELEADGVGGLRKLIYSFGRKPPEVYDLVADPGELQDRVAAGDVKVAALQPAIDRLLAWRDDSAKRYGGQDARRADALVGRVAPALLRPDAPFDLRFSRDGVDVVRLLDASWQQTDVEAGGYTHVRLVWQVLRPPGAAWTPFIHGQHGADVALRADHVPAEGSHPVAAWQAGDFIVDRVFVRPGPGIAVGQLDILAGFWRSKDDARLTARGSGLPRSADNRVLVGTLQVRKPSPPGLATPPATATKAALRPVKMAGVPGFSRGPLAGERPLDVAFTQPNGGAGAGACAGAGTIVRLRRAEIIGNGCPGGEVTLRLGFEVARAAPRFSSLFAHLRGHDGRHRNLGFVPGGGKLPVDAWRAGDAIVAERAFTLADDWPLGQSEIFIGFYGPNVSGPGERMAVVPASAASSPGMARALRFEVTPCP